MREIVGVARRVLVVGGWAPLLVFVVHVFATEVLDVYRSWPGLDIPMHFAGGVSVAYFISGCIQGLPWDRGRGGVILEALLVASLTTSAAVVWEFLEFAIDAVTGSNLQVSLANTMQDLALGMLGAGALIVARARRERAAPTGHEDPAMKAAARIRAE